MPWSYDLAIVPSSSRPKGDGWEPFGVTPTGEVAWRREVEVSSLPEAAPVETIGELRARLAVEVDAKVDPLEG